MYPTRREHRWAVVLALLIGVMLLAAPSGAAAQEGPTDARIEVQQPGDSPEPAEPAVPEVPLVPDVTLSVDSDDGSLSRTVVIILLLTVGSVAPGLLLLMTAFTRFVVVLGLTKQAIGMQTIPPSQVLVGLALFLTFFVMSPIFGEVNERAVQPLLAGEIGQAEAFETGFEPLRDFMLAQTREEDLQLFVDLSGSAQPANPEEVAATTLIPAFVISELRTAFIIGFVIFVPFLVVDLVVSAVLMSMGMMMLPPVFVSMPLKLLLFVLVDGWSLVVGSLVSSINGLA